MVLIPCGFNQLLALTAIISKLSPFHNGFDNLGGNFMSSFRCALNIYSSFFLGKVTALGVLCWFVLLFV